MPTCPNIPDTFMSASKYYSMHLQFTMRQATWLDRRRQKCNKHEFPPLSSALGDTHKQGSRKALNGLIKCYIALKRVLLLGHRLETAQRTTEERVPAKYICSFGT